MFSTTHFAGWGDMDFNSHMRNTAFLDKSADVRLMFFRETGFSSEEFHRLRIGPVIRRDEMEYFKEVRLMEEMRVTLAAAGLADDGSRFKLRNEFWLGEKLAARVTSEGGWLDLDKRKLVAPPEKLMAALRLLARTEDFRAL